MGYTSDRDGKTFAGEDVDGDEFVPHAALFYHPHLSK